VTRAALYVRISQDRTGKQAGVTRQTEDCQELVDQLGWDIAEIYTDNDKSATSGKVRPAYRRMLADIDAGKIDAIIGWHPDRIYRVVSELGELVEVCKRNNTQIATVKAGHIDLTTPTGRLVAGLLAQVSTYEGEAKADRWKRSVRQNREGGQFPPGVPRIFGYTRDGQVVPDEAATARWMATEIAGGRSVNGLTRALADQGVTSAAGGPWRVQSIKKYLTNPKLAGYSTLNGDIIGEGAWEPVLDRDTWETIRAVLNINAPRGARARVALLGGLLWCGKCEARMITGSRVSKRKEIVRTYRCPQVPGKEGCGAVSGLAGPIEEIVEAYARTRWEDPRVQQRQAELRGQAPEVLAELGDLEQRVVELEHQLDDPKASHVEVLLRAIDRAKVRVEELQAQLAATPAAAPPRGGGEWPTDLAARRGLVEAVVERAWLDPAPARSREFDPRRVRIDRRD